MSQNQRVLAYLKKHRSITARQAMRMGIDRMAARRYDLIQMGYDIKTELVQRGKKRFARYSL